MRKFNNILRIAEGRIKILSGRECELIIKFEDHDVTIDYVLDLVLTRHKLSKEYVLSDSRDRDAVKARSIYVVLAAKYCENDHTLIMAAINRDRTTLPNCFKFHRKYYNDSGSYRRRFKEIENQVREKIENYI